MYLTRLFATLLVIHSTAAGSTGGSCRDGTVTIKGRQCQKSCGYELSCDYYRSQKVSCYNDCVELCAKDSRCSSANWNRKSGLCSLSDKKQPQTKRTGKGDAVSSKKAKPSTTTCSTTKSKTSTTTTTSSRVPLPTCQAVENGSFEDIPDSQLDQDSITAGSWTCSANCQFRRNSADPNAFMTPFGSKYASLLYPQYENSDTRLSQQISGLIGTYTLSYQYAVEDLSARDPCTLTVTAGGDTVDDVFVSQADPSGRFQSRTTQPFVPSGPSIRLEFSWSCFGDTEGRVAIDLVAVTSSLDGTPLCEE